MRPYRGGIGQWSWALHRFTGVGVLIFLCLHILDTSDPLNPVEFGHFDTSPYQTGPGFSGAWSTYPFFESGTILVTSLQEGLFILKKRPRPVS